MVIVVTIMFAMDGSFYIDDNETDQGDDKCAKDIDNGNNVREGFESNMKKNIHNGLMVYTHIGFEQ